MARPRRISDEDLLAIAREVFIEHGAGASVGLVAERAGISAPAIFRRFGTKEHLFAEAMVPPGGIPEFITYLGSFEDRRALLPRGLRAVAAQAFAFMRQVAPLSMQVWAARQDAPPVIAFDELLRTVTRLQNRGVFPDCDVRAFVLTFFGAIHSLALLDMLQGVDDVDGALDAITDFTIRALTTGETGNPAKESP